VFLSPTTEGASAECVCAKTKSCALTHSYTAFHHELVLNFLTVPQLNGENTDVDRKMTTLSEENATLKSLDGFLLVLSTDGDITYVSENIADFLGLSQVRDSWSCQLPVFESFFAFYGISD
jgi:hypothetical protein